MGPLRPLYVLLCEDNVFRLLPGQHGMMAHLASCRLLTERGGAGDDLQGPEAGGAVRQAFESAFPGRKVEEALLPPKSSWRRVRQGCLSSSTQRLRGGGWGVGPDGRMAAVEVRKPPAQQSLRWWLQS